MKRQLTALLVAMAVALSLLGVSALAADSSDPAPEAVETETNQQPDTSPAKEEVPEESSPEEQTAGEEAKSEAKRS